MKKTACLTLVLIAVGYLGCPSAVWGEPKTSVQEIQLRSQAWVVSDDEASEQFGLTDWDWKPLQYVQNNFEEQAETVIDHATGLMWQKTITEGRMEYEDALKYIKELNERQFAGYNDWRLPTLPELLSLLEPERQKESLGFYIDPIFPPPPAGNYGCWSADHRPSRADTEWSVSFSHARVFGFPQPLNFVRAVRSVN